MYLSASLRSLRCSFFSLAAVFIRLLSLSLQQLLKYFSIQPMKLPEGRNSGLNVAVVSEWGGVQVAECTCFRVHLTQGSKALNL